MNEDASILACFIPQADNLAAIDIDFFAHFKSLQVFFLFFIFFNKLCLNNNNTTTVPRSRVNEKRWRFLWLKKLFRTISKYLFKVWVHVSEWFESMSAKLSSVMLIHGLLHRHFYIDSINGCLHSSDLWDIVLQVRISAARVHGV